MPLRFCRSLRYALHGWAVAWKEERNFRLQVVAGSAALLTGWALSFTLAEMLTIGFCILLVLGAEILNTIVEDLLNFLHPDRDPRVGKIKDLAASLVLLQSLGACVIGGTILLHHLR